jgi:PAS domain S-box-containing protein
MTAISQEQAVVIVRDITDRKKAEEELEIQKVYFEQLFERSPDAIALLNINSKIRDINESFSKLFGFEKDEIVGKQINELIIPEESKEEAYNMSNRIRNGQIIQVELQRIDNKGNKIDVYHLAYPIELENEKVGIYALYRDIRDRKKAKTMTYSVLFGNHVYKSKSDKMFQKLFPTIFNFINLYKRDCGNYKKLSCDLQRMESNVIFNRIVKTVMERNPSIKMITVHDSIIVPIEHYDYVNDIFQKILLSEFSF